MSTKVKSPKMQQVRFFLSRLVDMTNTISTVCESNGKLMMMMIMKKMSIMLE